MNSKYALPEPGFKSELVSLLFEIERLRANIGTGTTPTDIYIELHQLFDTVMSVVSARIEGNHTTVYEAIENSSATNTQPPSDPLREILNIAGTAHFVDSIDLDTPLTHSFIRELHARTVADLEREGDPNPGNYRNQDVAISGSAHTPPSWVTVHAEMTGLLDFANSEVPLNEQMLQIAIAHHRFVWIHPFGNGNGRVSRLFTYAMLRKAIFAKRGYSALNPTSVFGNDRHKYISALELADSLTPEGDAAWATFFVRGIRNDLDRVLNLQDHEYVISHLVAPAINGLVTDGIINSDTARILTVILEKGVVKASDLTFDSADSSSKRSRKITQLRDRFLIRPIHEGARFYTLSLARGPIARKLIQQLDFLGFLPKMLSDD
ncbi:Fic family protein [Jonesiaceae bacterium BS-20]|uniref:Fic family protein n=1 Tax=Jonesiaceae bacterium BS-20 TaxID=3120821 RepID=A0AAU7DVC0_9MICO